MFKENMDDFFSDFSVEGAILRSSAEDLSGVDIILDRNVEVLIDGGMSTERRDVLTFRKDQLFVNGAEIVLTKNDSVVIGSDTYELFHLLQADGEVVSWYAR
tara:strand:- start:1022 stop:1327 length:306 start_codon:yes stop_codon:yes gene_type:complete